MAAQPPITIGELLDVPAPRSGIKSAWAQEVSARIVHRFADRPTLLAQWPPAAANRGSLAYTVDRGILWCSTGAVWEYVRGTLATGRAGFAVRRTTALAVAANGTVVIPWETKVYDPDNWLSGTLPNTTLTVPAGWAGVYAIALRVAWASSFAANGMHLLNGGGNNTVSQSAWGANAVTGLTAVVELTAGQTFTLSAFQNSAGAVNTGQIDLTCYRVDR